MQFLEHFYLRNVKRDLYNRFYYECHWRDGSVSGLPKIKKIILNFGCKTSDKKRLVSSLLALELISQQKGKLTTTKDPSILLKLKKGNPVGCKVTLRKKQMFYFLEKVLMVIFPKISNFDGIVVNSNEQQKTFTFQIHNTIDFHELEPHYYLFHELNKLSVTIVTTAKTEKELLFLLHAIQFPIKNK